MKETTQQEKDQAYRIWYHNYEFKLLDKEITPFLNEELTAFAVGKNEWIKKIRQGLFLSPDVLCEKMKISRSTYTKYELGEMSGSISLSNLSKIAEAMDCEMIYAIRPKSKTYFSSHVWRKLSDSASQHPSLRCYDPRHRPKSIAAIATRLMKDPKFKKEQGWSQRANQKIDE